MKIWATNFHCPWTPGSQPDDDVALDAAARKHAGLNMGRESRVKKPPLSLRDHLLVALRRSSIRRVAFWYADMARPPGLVPDRVLREPPAAALAKSMGPTSTAADVETSVQHLIESGFLARLPDGRLLLAGDDGPLTPRRIALAMWPDARPDGEAMIDAVTHEDLAAAVRAED